jgi:hypothetical protein
MTAATDKRADRFPVPLKVYYSYERVEGAASLTNISYTGALLENTPMRPEIGTCVQLYVHLIEIRINKAIVNAKKGEALIGGCICAGGGGISGCLEACGEGDDPAR